LKITIALPYFIYLFFKKYGLWLITISMAYYYYYYYYYHYGLKNEFFSWALPLVPPKSTHSHGSHGALAADRVHRVGTPGAGIRRGHGAARGRQVEDRGTTGGTIESSLIYLLKYMSLSNIVHSCLMFFVCLPKGDHLVQ
jgi:hypothetical protein